MAALRTGYRLAVLCLFLFAALPAAAQTTQYVGVYFDVDENPATGCDAQGFQGAEHRLLITLSVVNAPESAEVTALTLADCVDAGTDTFGPPSPVAGEPGPPPWPVGLGLGVDGSDVIEAYVPRNVFPAQDDVVRAGIVSGVDEPPGDVMYVTLGGGDAPILIALANLIIIPTLSEWMLILLAAVLACLALLTLRRRPARMAFLVAFLALALTAGAAGVAWAACVMDGMIDEWGGASPLAEDPTGDAVGTTPDLRAFFAMDDGITVCLRIDAFVAFNQGPDAMDDSYATDEDTALMVPAPGVLGNDSDPDSDPIQVTAADAVSAQGAAVTVMADGSFTYDPTGSAALKSLPAGDMVDDTFGYTIDDGSGNPDTATVTVTVTGVNDAPTAMDDTYETDEDVDLVIAAPGVLVNDDDVDTGDTLTAVLDTDVSDGTLTLNADGSFTYEPDPDFNGTDSFTYHANDGLADSPTVTATITVGPVNDGPNAVDDMFATDEDTVLNEPADGVLLNDTDPEGDMLTVTAYDALSTQGAAVTVNADGSFTYDPMGSAALQALAAGAMVDDTFTYTIEDPSGTPDTATVTIEVTGVDDPPTAEDDAATVTEDDPPATLDVQANDTDVDGGPSTISMVAQPVNGTVVITNMGADLTYEPDPEYCNDGLTTDDFTYTLSPGGDTATVAVTVTCVNDPPMADDETFDAVCNLEHVVEADPGETAEGGAPVFRTIADNVLVGDSDPVEGTAVTIVQVDGTTSDGTAPFTVTTNQGGTVTLNADGSFVYTPEGGDRSVADTFTYTIQDADGGMDTATVTLNVGSACVWFVDNTGFPGADDAGTGTSSDPFASMVDEEGPDALADDAEDASLAGDVVYVFTGEEPYVGGYAAQSNERIFGEGVDLVVDLGSGPETLFDSVANTPPEVDAPADAFTVTDVTGVEIAGFSIDAGDNALDFTAPATGAGASFHDNTVTASVGPAVRGNPVAGASELSLVDNVLASSDQGVDVDVNPPATLDLVVDGNSANTVGTAFDLNGNGTRVTSICGNTVSGDSGNHGFALEALLIDADPGTLALDQVTCAQPTTVGAMGNPVPRHGITLDTVVGDLNLGQVTVHAGTAGGLTDLAFQVSGDGAFNAAAGTGFQLTTTGGTVHAVHGPALRLQDVDLQNMVLGTVTVDSSDFEGIGFDGVTGSLVTNGGDSSITGTTQEAFRIVDSPAVLTVTYDGDITNALDSTILVDGHPGGTVTFSGGTIGATGGDGFQFDDADGTYLVSSTANLNGGDAGLDIVNGSGGAFTFTGLSITSPSGPGIRVADSAPSSVDFNTAGSLTYATVGQPALLLQNRGAGTFTYTRPVTVTNGTGLRFDNDDGTTASFNSTVTLNGGDAGIDIINGSSGTYTFANTTITNPSGVGFNVDSSSGSITWSAGGVTQNNAVSAVRFNNHGGGIVTISAPVTGNTATANAVDLTGANAGIYNLRGGLDLDTTTGTAFNATGGGTVNVCDDSLCNGTGSAVTNTVDVVGAAVAGINFVNTTIGTSGVTFDTVNVNGAADGINLTNAGAGDFAALGGTIQNVTARGVDVSGGSGDVRVDASIDTTTAGRSVEVTTHTGGTVDFNGFIDDDGLGIRLANNVGSILRFDGGMDVDTAAGAGAEEGFEATGGGTVHVTGTNDVNTSLATGIAVHIAGGTTIGSDDVTFRNVSANGAVSGIVLDGTGSSGAFEVTGVGTTDESGGVIDDTTGDAVVLTSVDDVTLRNMRLGESTTAQGDAPDSSIAIAGDAIDITSSSNLTFSNLRIADTSGDGIKGTGVTHLALSNSEIFNVGLDAGSDETAFDFGDQTAGVDSNLLGTVTIADTVFDGMQEFGVYVYNETGALDLDVSGGRFSNQRTNNAESGILVETDGTATMDVSVTGITCDVLEGGACVFAQALDGTIDLVATGNTVENGGSVSNFNNTDGFNLATGDGTLNFDISDNSIQRNRGHGVRLAANFGGRLNGQVSGNDIDGDGPFPPAASAQPILVQIDGGGAGDPTAFIRIHDNDIDDVVDTILELIDVEARDGVTSLDIIITNNRLNQDAGATLGDGDHGIEVRARDSASVRANVSNNVVSSPDASINLDVEDSSSMEATVVANTLASSGDDELQAETEDAGTSLCLDLRSHTSGVLVLTESAGTFTLENFASVAGDNSGATVTVGAGITADGGTCIEPTAPTFPSP